MTFSDIRELVADNKLRAALEGLEKLAQKADLQHFKSDITQLFARYNDLRRKANIGVFSSDEQFLRQSQMTNSILELTSRMEQNKPQKQSETPLNTSTNTTAPSPTSEKNPINYKLFAFFGILVLLIFFAAFREPCPSASQMWFYHIIIAIGVAGLAAGIPGFLDIKYKGIISAGGALGIFVIVYLMQPAQLVTNDNCAKDFNLTVHTRTAEGDYEAFSGEKFGLRLGTHRIDPKSVNENGEVVFDNISSQYLKDTALLEPRNARIKVLHQDNWTAETSQEITFTLERLVDSTTVYGCVLDENRRKIPDVDIVFAHQYKTKTGADGCYKITLPKASGEMVNVAVSIDNQELIRRNQTIDSSIAIDFKLPK